tara:strand:- start:538 stop:714 length:177 start_codon:yes stop_codon:yes gene_type:complete
LNYKTPAALERKSKLKTLNLPLDKKVYFAGEIYYLYQQMGVLGAILSGYYSADKLLSE